MVFAPSQISELELDAVEGQLTQTVVLSNISWQTYQAILVDMGEHRSTRLSYDQGILILKMPSTLHEIINRLLARIVTTLTEELGLEIVNIGSTTLDNEALKKGAEPDTGFYIQNALLLEGLDPQIPADLPPDLVIEVDIASPSTQRMHIYHALKVPEIWRYTKQKGLTIYGLDLGNYQELGTSQIFPTLSSEQLNKFLDWRKTQSENQVIRAVRDWIQTKK